MGKLPDQGGDTLAFSFWGEGEVSSLLWIFRVLLAGVLLSVPMLTPVVAVASGAELDLKSEPKGVPPAKTQQRLWDAYKTARVCFEHPDYDPGTGQAVPILPAASFSASAWQSPLAENTGAPECRTSMGPMQTPKPIATVKLDETYGARVGGIDIATGWFLNTTSYVRLTNDPLARALLKQGVVEWAKGKGLSKGIHVSWGSKPVDYQMMSMILSVLSATAAVAPDFSADERAVVGPWLNDLVKQVAAGHWKDRQDNKAYMKTYAAMLWGLIVGDNRPVQDAIFVYKLAVHDMRPDGSWPIDSQREQRGLHYGSAATSHLVTMATALQSARGIDLFGYAVDGRSVHTAVDFVVASMQDPAAMNRKYAIACPDGGHLNNGGIGKPDLNHYDEAGYLIAYAERFPDRESSRFILTHYARKMSIGSEKNGGAPQCLFALNGGGVTMPALVMPPPPPSLPAPKFVVHAKEEISYQDTGSFINSFIVGSIEGAKKGEQTLEFNIVGNYSAALKNFLALRFVVNDDLDKAGLAAAAACGAKVEIYDEATSHLAIDINVASDVLTVRNADCIAKTFKGRTGATARFLLNSFRDVAIGMVLDGTAGAVKNRYLVEFLTRIATGEVTANLQAK
jgi:hypothetical protein